ncbi:GntR family transcriptional regulator [Streptococcus caprae]|uniref:GntR family transcriptional regulator n=1 Tax=Streptococcus caprae TaxID=1640501 RepID=A0ABV8CVY7_9STRE
MFKFLEKQSLYIQLADYLENEIRLNFVPNQKLKSERELTEEYQVSRITVRQALQELEKRGLIYKKQGLGTFVSEVLEPSVDLSLIYSFTDHMKKIGKVPSTRILSFRKVSASESIANQLNVPFGSTLYEIERLRLANDVPMMFERTYLPAEIFPNLVEDMLNMNPLYTIFKENYEQSIRSLEEEFYASLALDRESEFLNIRRQSAVLHIIRKSFNQKNIPIEYTFSIARADQFKYRVSVKGRSF